MHTNGATDATIPAYPERPSDGAEEHWGQTRGDQGTEQGNAALSAKPGRWLLAHTAAGQHSTPRAPRSPSYAPSSALCCGVAASSLLASLAMERVMRPLRRPWLLAVLRPLEVTASFSSLSSPDVSSFLSLQNQGEKKSPLGWHRF